MRPTLSSTRLALLICLPVLAMFFAAALHAQSESDRPPWARKKKSNSGSSAPACTAPASTGSSTSTTSPTPPTIVNPMGSNSADGDSDGQSSQERDRIRVSVNLVNVLASVLDDHNRPAPDLPREAFQLFEEGFEQKIEVFEQDSALRFLRQVLRKDDRASIFAISEDVHQLANYTGDFGQLQSALHRMPPGAGTSIYDGLLLGARTLERRGDDRRHVIVLITDGGETTSSTDFDAARKAAVRSGALLYTIVVRPVKNESGRNTAGEHALSAITDTMGGAMFYPDAITELDAIFDRINRELRTQYRLGYYPTPRGPANTYRSIEVRISTENAGTTNASATYQVRHRKAYLTGPQ